MGVRDHARQSTRCWFRFLAEARHGAVWQLAWRRPGCLAQPERRRPEPDLDIRGPRFSLCDGHTKPAAGLTDVAADIPPFQELAHELRARRKRTSRSDQTTVRRANLGVVLQQIAGGEPRSRARVAAETGLTRGTVSSLVGELIELDLLRETGEDERSGRAGRPGLALELSDRVVAVGLEVNVDYLAVCVEDLAGQRPLREARPHRQSTQRSPGRCSTGSHAWRAGRDERDRGGGSRRRPESPSRFPGLVAAETGDAAPRPEPRLVGHRGRGRDLRRGSAAFPSAPTTRRTSPRSPSTGRESRAASTTSSASSPRSAWARGIFIGGDLFRGVARLRRRARPHHGRAWRAAVPVRCTSAVSRRSSARKRSRVAPASATDDKRRARNVTRELVRRAEQGDAAVHREPRRGGPRTSASALPRP